VASVQEQNEEKIKKEKDEISELTSVLKENKQELEFLKHHGSNNQIFLALRKQITNDLDVCVYFTVYFRRW
jgi:hypothetical protein